MLGLLWCGRKRDLGIQKILELDMTTRVYDVRKAWRRRSSS
jgi:hypothetical protein